MKRNGFLHFLLAYALPFILLNAVIFILVTAQPRFDVEIVDSPDFTYAEIFVRVRSHFPNKGLKVTLDGEPLEMEEKEKNTYYTWVDHNGTVEASLTNINGMNKTVYENVVCIDDAPPIITEGDAAPGYISIYVDDLQSGVDYEKSYAIDDQGNMVTPSLLDEGEGLIVFNFDQESLEVHIFDKAGHESIATFGAVYVTEGEQQ